MLQWYCETIDFAKSLKSSVSSRNHWFTPEFNLKEAKVFHEITIMPMSSCRLAVKSDIITNILRRKPAL